MTSKVEYGMSLWHGCMPSSDLSAFASACLQRLTRWWQGSRSRVLHGGVRVVRPFKT